MNLVLPDLIAGIAKDNGMKLIDIFKRFGGAHDPETPEHKSDTNKVRFSFFALRSSRARGDWLDEVCVRHARSSLPE